MLEKANQLSAELSRLRREIHQHPELSFQGIQNGRFSCRHPGRNWYSSQNRGRAHRCCRPNWHRQWSNDCYSCRHGRAAHS